MSLVDVAGARNNPAADLAECPLWVISGHFGIADQCPLYLQKPTRTDRPSTTKGVKPIYRRPNLTAALLTYGLSIIDTRFVFACIGSQAFFLFEKTTVIVA
jgi:hypothetical protein